jgi:hypothetical protein
MPRMSLPKRNPRRSLAAVLAAGVLAAGGVVLAAAGPAAAAPAGCPYPYVCFYRSGPDYDAGRAISRYRDVTDGWQYLRPQSVGALYAYNSRHDDVAYLHLADDPDHPFCLAPGRTAYLFEAGVDRIRISTEATCP